jgi:hypothetical protein
MFLTSLAGGRGLLPGTDAVGDGASCLTVNFVSSAGFGPVGRRGCTFAVVEIDHEQPGFGRFGAGQGFGGVAGG